MKTTEDAQSQVDERVIADSGMFAGVLCAIDGTTESLAAVEQAATLAGPNGHLTLLEVTSFEAEGAYRSPAIAPLKAKSILDQAAAIAKAAGVSITSEVDPASPPASVVLDWAAERDLLAIGAPATSWFGGMFMGGVAVSAEEEFTTPMLVARTMGSEPRFADRILIASDGLAGSDELVDLGGRLARAQGAGVILLHAIGLESKARRRRVEEQARRLELDIDDASQVRLEGGSARSMIVETASALGASLVVMGSRRLKGLRVIGSVSRRVVHQGHCSVLLVPPERLRARATPG
ncbi:MAG: universal stress protein [Solirubrobacterales bacterium]